MTQLELKLANSNSDSCRKYSSSILTVYYTVYRQVYLLRFSSAAVCWWWSHTAHAHM